jgi:hypothetical protein
MCTKEKMPRKPGNRTGYIVCGAQCKIKMQMPWFKNYCEFLNDDNILLNQGWVIPSSGIGLTA